MPLFVKLGDSGHVVCYELDDIKTRLGFGRNSMVNFFVFFLLLCLCLYTSSNVVFSRAGSFTYKISFLSYDQIFNQRPRIISKWFADYICSTSR